MYCARLRILLLLLAAVAHEVAEQVLNLILWLEECLSEVIQASDVLDRVRFKCFDVLLCDRHDRNHCVVKDIFHKWFQFFHGIHHAGRCRNELNHIVQAFRSYETCLVLEQQLQMGVKQCQGELKLEIVCKRFDVRLVFYFRRVAILHEYPVCSFGGDSLYFPVYRFISSVYLIRVGRLRVEGSGNRQV